MKKETLKTIALVLLVISSIILTINNWFSEKLWPDGYNFFSNLANYFVIDKAPKSYYLSKENVSNPNKIIVTNDVHRGVYTHTSTEFNDMVGPVKNILKMGLTEGTAEETTPEAWKDALKYKSIYMSYPVEYGTKTFSAILDTPITSIGEGSVREFVLVSGDNITGKPHLLIKDISAGSYWDITLSTNSQEIDSLISKYATASVGEYPYSFELNFDKGDDSSEQKVIIDSQVILSINPVTASTMTETNYFEDIAENKELYTAFLQAFGFNASNIRKNVNIDNSIVFAENYGTIKMYPDGLLEFRSLDETKGIDIGSSSEFYDTFIDCIEFVNNVWDTACHETNMNINLSSAKISGDNNSFALTIDYYADGMEVVTTLAPTESHPRMNHAIELEVHNSKIISYRQVVKGYTSNNDTIMCSSVIDALDVLMAKDSIKSDTITDLYLAYSPDSTGLCSPYWIAQTAKNEIRIIKDK